MLRFAAHIPLFRKSLYDDFLLSALRNTESVFPIHPKLCLKPHKLPRQINQPDVNASLMDTAT